MSSEAERIVDQLERAYAGDPWHGPSLRHLLENIGSQQACLRPLPSGHTIWELVVHIDLYAVIAIEATQGTPMPRWYGTERDWPVVLDNSDDAWKIARDRLFANAERLTHAVGSFRDVRLRDKVPGRDYDFYYLFHGIVQHSAYHGGQIAMLKRATE